MSLPSGEMSGVRAMRIGSCVRAAAADRDRAREAMTGTSGCVMGGPWQDRDKTTAHSESQRSLINRVDEAGSLQPQGCYYSLQCNPRRGREANAKLGGVEAKGRSGEVTEQHFAGAVEAEGERVRHAPADEHGRAALAEAQA